MVAAPSLALHLESLHQSKQRQNETFPLTQARSWKGSCVVQKIKKKKNASSTENKRKATKVGVSPKWVKRRSCWIAREAVAAGAGSRAGGRRVAKQFPVDFSLIFFSLNHRLYLLKQKHGGKPRPPFLLPPTSSMSPSPPPLHCPFVAKELHSI